MGNGLYENHPYNCTEKTYLTTCDQCGQDVVYWRCLHGSRVFFNPMPFGGDHRLDCPGVKAPQDGPLKPSQQLLKNQPSKIGAGKPTIQEEISQLLANYQAEVKAQIEDFTRAPTHPTFHEKPARKRIPDIKKPGKIPASNLRQADKLPKLKKGSVYEPKHAKWTDKGIGGPYLIRLLRRALSFFGRTGRQG